MFHEYKNIVENGDLVVVYSTPETMTTMTVCSGEIFNNRFGSFRHSDMVGLKYGSKIQSHTGRGFVYLLHPTPALWTQVVPHRTQILYLPDISFISLYLNLMPGKIVIESGTGSGSFSHSIARTIAPSGHLYTFEYHELRANTARKEFDEHSLANMVTIEHRDVIANGFGRTNIADAVFLDLPAPWDAVEAAKQALRKDTIGRICCFSPCIEQVQRTTLALNEHGFAEIRMFECLAKDYEFRNAPLPDIDVAISGKKVSFKSVKSDKKRKRDEDAANMEEKDELPTMILTKPVDEVRGHTSYLTFAILAPKEHE
ncbi:tRNA (adenine-N(1)-)-methyltransferase catalytic subunit trm61 [Coemansia sp. RSA 1822]|nr:tRNA (adenine-N(1)-)-methyltransferase catalytic subunit trm61 [Coemansia sp. RSA 638]KAJ2482628.1 tRNA (adenine-N(1)-)-methyltransferase catalytic subunit trm61 [Coemansia sp. RSA 2131]KAJ2543763.1 tRNA (adenine-N(1)-)-methyltransferase catalytic subunit trm61 [Coemansia sp. RSA 1853]KAJ2561831.1 tRNA (adenine-N(1)-)-methyltransferase catalytic subunit trm61 [Coemansia sp. RSA 1822]